MKNLFGAGATAFLMCLDMAVKSEVEKWPDEEEKPFADSKKIVLRKVHNKGMCMSLLKEYPQFVKYTSLVMAGILTVLDILCLRKKGSYLKKQGFRLVWQVRGATHWIAGCGDMWWIISGFRPLMRS